VIENEANVKEIIDCVNYYKNGDPAEFLKDMNSISTKSIPAMIKEYKPDSEQKQEIIDICKNIFDLCKNDSICNYIIPFHDIEEFQDKGSPEDAFTLIWDETDCVAYFHRETLECYFQNNGCMPLGHYALWQEGTESFPVPSVNDFPEKLLNEVSNLFNNSLWEE
jgi:hypothetical protein